MSSATPTKFRVFDIPQSLRSHLDSWGRNLRNTVEMVRVRWMKMNPSVLAFRSLKDAVPSLGTDCSGAEAPVWALKQMMIPHKHVWSCDCDPTVREFIQSCSPPADKLYADMLNRATDETPNVDIYVCGFPCTPYSMLRAHKTKKFKEAAAKPYFAMLKFLRIKRPPLAVLENVGGLRRLLRKVLSDLARLKCYHVIWMMMDSADLGEPVSRPRCYFLLLRRDVSASSDIHVLAKFCELCLQATRVPVSVHVKARMLPSTHPAVLAYIHQAQQKRQQKKRQSGSRVGDKWMSKHEAYKKNTQTVQGFRGTTASASGGMPLNSERQRAAWSLLTKQHGQNIIADVSQSIDRCHVRTSGICPTLTPRGVCCVGPLQRYVLPFEKLLLHGFPLHKMQVPATISDEKLGLMGGNTMHLQCIGLALLMGMSLLKTPVPQPPSDSVFPQRGSCVQAHSVAQTTGKEGEEAPAGKRQRVI